MQLFAFFALPAANWERPFAWRQGELEWEISVGHGFMGDKEGPG